MVEIWWYIRQITIMDAMAKEAEKLQQEGEAQSMKQDKLSNGMERTTYEQKDYEQKGPVAPIGYEDLWTRADKPYPSPVGPADGPREPAGTGSGSAQIAGYGHSGPLVERVERIIGEGLGGAKRVGTGIPDGHDTEMAKVQADPTSKRETAIPAEGDKRQTGGKRSHLELAKLAVVDELILAEMKHGRLTDDMQRAVLIVAEEFGELVKEVTDFTRANGKWTTNKSLTATELAIQHEARQLAAIALAFLENVIERRFTCQHPNQSK